MSPSELKRFGVLEELSEGEREILADLLRESEFATGETLFEEGDESLAWVLVIDGELELTSTRAGRLGRAGVGCAFGGLGLVAAGRREMTARAADACRVLWLDRVRYRRLVQDEPRLACKLQEAILRDLATTLREGLPAFETGAV